MPFFAQGARLDLTGATEVRYCRPARTHPILFCAQYSAQSNHGPTMRQPNILFLFPDQLRHDWTGANPDLPLRTPHLERSMRGERALATPFVPRRCARPVGLASPLVASIRARPYWEMRITYRPTGRRSIPTYAMWAITLWAAASWTSIKATALRVALRGG
jgi:hypothetical protein